MPRPHHPIRPAQPKPAGPAGRATNSRHPLDRLERGGWIDRSRDPSDRRGVVVEAARGRGAEILRLYLVDSGMNTAMDQICSEYEDKSSIPQVHLPAPHRRRQPNRRPQAHRKLSREDDG